MKMILAVMPTNLSELASKALLENSYRVTKFASTASFLAGGTTTLMVGVEASKVASCLDLIRKQVPARDEPNPAQPRVTIYVLGIKEHTRV